jgi:hypothetical protein
VNDEPRDHPRVTHWSKFYEWTVDCECLACGWPWRLYGVAETRAVDIHKTVKCPNCGVEYMLNIHHE